jgi:hypothetical protein
MIRQSGLDWWLLLALWTSIWAAKNLIQMSQQRFGQRALYPMGEMSEQINLACAGKPIWLARVSKDFLAGLGQLALQSKFFGTYQMGSLVWRDETVSRKTTKHGLVFLYPCSLIGDLHI